MKKLTLLLLLGIVFTWTSCNDDTEVCSNPVTTDSDANLTEFLGLWYEVASFPSFFSGGCNCTTAEYTLSADGNSVIVNNNCTLSDSSSSGIQGTAVPADPNDFSKLLVSFPVSPVPGDYWILEFDGDSHMLVGNPDRDNLFVLSRKRTLDPTIYNALVDKAEVMCFDVNQLQLTPQDNCEAL